MTTTVIRSGYDAHIDADHPNTPHQKAKALRLDFGELRGLLYMPLSGIRGRTVLSAELTGHAGTGGLPASKTLTFAPVVEGWSAAEATWANQPGLLGTGSATFNTGAGVAAGAEFPVDVTTAVQSVSTGAAWFGWRITTNHTSPIEVRAFNAAAVAWTLTVELSDVPAQPTMQSPNGGVVSRPKPVLAWDFTDLGAFSDQAAAQVQIDPASDGVTPNFDSGILAIKDPELDTATTAYAGLVSGASDAWRVRAKGESGIWSPWSDWAPFTYVPKPAITLLSPSAGVLWDPTAEILASVAPATMEAFRIRIASATDRTDVLYDSFKQTAGNPALVALEMPAKNANENRILVDDRDYQLNIRVWDDEDREATPGDPLYVDSWSTFHFDDDGALTPVATTSVNQVDGTPIRRWTWTRSSAADKWVLFDNGRIFATLEPEDTVVGTGTYSWVDDGSASPNLRHSCYVKGVVNNRQSRPGPHSVITTDVRGLWLLSEHGNVCIDGLGIDGFRSLDKRATYKLLRGPDVDIIHGFEGITVDQFTGTIENRSDQTYAEAQAILDAIKADPVTPVRLVWATRSVVGRLRNLYTVPTGGNEGWTARTMRHDVSFGFWQTGEF